MFKEVKVYFILSLMCFGAGYLAKTIQEPARVDEKLISEYQSEIKSLGQKLTDSESNIEKMKSEQKNKKKVLVTQADGSSTLTEEESSSSLESEFFSLKSKNIEYQNMIATLSESVTKEKETRNNLLRFDGRIVFDSERGQEYEVSAGYKFYSGGAGVNPEKHAWRASAGLGWSF